MSKKTTASSSENKDREDSAEPEPLVEEQRLRPYYYDDSYGYEDFEPESEGENTDEMDQQ
jgi:hypothetical protein